MSDEEATASSSGLADMLLPREGEAVALNLGAIPKDLNVIAFYRWLRRVFCSSMFPSSALPLSAFLPDVVLLLSANLAGGEGMTIATLVNEAASLGNQELLLDFTREF